MVPMNEDLILDIMSYCPATAISKFRLLNKACNKRSYEFYFINHHHHRTNSVLGYFIQDHKKQQRPGFVIFGADEEAPEKLRISLEFLPSRDAKIEACDARHGILLCVDNNKYKGGRRIPDYIVCKPATKQYRIIPNPKTRHFTVAIGLMVIQSNPFRYKIVRVSEPRPWERRKTSEGFDNLNCEVFDSDTYAWKRLNDLELPSGDFFRISKKPESLYGFLHWLTGKNNVIRFCMQTETWSFFPLPEDVIGDRSSLNLVSYEGKLAVLRSNWNLREEYDLWVLDKSLGKSWAKVKDVQVTDSKKYAKPLWFLSNDVILVAGYCSVGLYNTNSNKFQYLHTTTHESFHYFLPRDVCFPFYSNFERICLNEDRTGRSKTKQS